MMSKIAPPVAAVGAADLLQSIRDNPAGSTLAELLTRHPGVARRTAQRWLAQSVANGQIAPQGDARARRYLTRSLPPDVAHAAKSLEPADHFPATIPLSADSRDVLAYVVGPAKFIFA